MCIPGAERFEKLLRGYAARGSLKSAWTKFRFLLALTFLLDGNPSMSTVSLILAPLHFSPFRSKQLLTASSGVAISTLNSLIQRNIWGYFHFMFCFIGDFRLPLEARNCGRCWWDCTFDQRYKFVSTVFFFYPRGNDIGIIKPGFFSFFIYQYIFLYGQVF